MGRDPDPLTELDKNLLKCYTVDETLLCGTKKHSYIIMKYKRLGSLKGFV
jgi:hypothetical protein